MNLRGISRPTGPDKGVELSHDITVAYPSVSSILYKLAIIIVAFCKLKA